MYHMIYATYQVYEGFSYWPPSCIKPALQQLADFSEFNKNVFQVTIFHTTEDMDEFIIMLLMLDT